MSYVPERGLFNLEAPDKARVVAKLLKLRAATAGAGNRRPLFTSMDTLLAEAGDGPAVALLDAPVNAGAGSVRLARLRLRNWKAFERADLSLPEGGDAHQVVVIGGANGFGKSSILEAFAIGLFGRKAISDVGFLMQATQSRGGRRRAYRTLMERNLHRSSQAKAEAMCSVTLDFDTAAGPICVERKWYFDDDGHLLEDEEELLLRVGEDRDLLETPAGIEAREWYEEEIQHRVMPSALAPFFVFDGEQVERWAERKLEEQVQSAVTRILGMDGLHDLIDDLRAYAADRDRTGGVGGTADLRATTELDGLETELRDSERQLAENEASLAELRGQRDETFASLSSLGTSSHAEMQTILETRHRLSLELTSRHRELMSVIAESGPLMLVGGRLLKQTTASIRTDVEQDISGPTPEMIDAAWGRFVGSVSELGPELIKSLRQRFFDALTSNDQRISSGSHCHLDFTVARSILPKIANGISGGRRQVSEAMEAVRKAASALLAAQNEEESTRQRSAERAEVQTRLGELSSVIEAAEAARGSNRRHVESLTAQLKPLRAEAAARAARLRDAEPRLRLAEAARSLALSLENHLSVIAEGEYRRLAEEVTHSFRELSHKDQIDRISIDPDGSVTLFDSAGQDVTEYRLSAGESQLFALSLIAAVGTIAGDRLPLLVDTPLSRLDTRHRESVLRMFARRRAQTILLTQPEEITSRHLRQIRPVLAGAMTLAHRKMTDSGVGNSTFEQGYDPDADETGNDISRRIVA